MTSYKLNCLKIFLGLILIAGVLTAASEQIVTEELIRIMGEQLLLKDRVINGKLPDYTENGRWIFRDKVNWFSGMTAGELFTFYELTGGEHYKTLGLKYAQALIPYAGIDYTHDMGFILCRLL